MERIERSGKKEAPEYRRKTDQLAGCFSDYFLKIKNPSTKLTGEQMQA